MFCVFFMIPGRRVGFPSSQKKCIYSVVEVEVNGSVFLHRLFGTSPLVPSRPLFPSLTLPPRLQPPVRWEMGNPDRLCIAVDCIVFHCIACIVSHVAVQSEYISVHFTGDVPSWPFVQFQPLFGAQTLLQGDVARFMQKLYRSFAHSQALDSWILDEIGNSMYILVTMSVVLIDFSGTGARRKPLVELSRAPGFSAHCCAGCLDGHGMELPHCNLWTHTITVMN